ncbi:hypothetical protein B9Z19DRAFT_1108678 [Tuber borchii]|uniref:Uncharacterized protein n=1 Tax=Tuber borchii TaxID=42251 RepID=A0A2T6ZQM0_TUBBO|nr:hypothetical protein B9Z19DRAFT_1108678 [Tuber borchii]
MSGGFRIASTEDTGEIQDTENDLPVLTFSLPTTGEGKPLGIRSGTYLARPTTPVGTARAEPGSSTPFSAPNKGSNSTILPEPAGDSTVPAVPTRASTLLSVPPTNRTILPVLSSHCTVLPSPSSDSTVPPSPSSDSTFLPVLVSVFTRIWEFQIPLENIFANDQPKVLDPKDSIIFSLRELEAHVIGSPQGTTKPPRLLGDLAE